MKSALNFITATSNQHTLITAKSAPAFKPRNELPELPQSPAVQCVKCTFAFFPADEESAFIQSHHVVRECRLPYAEMFKKLACALFAVSQQLYYLDSVGITQSLADQ